LASDLSATANESIAEGSFTIMLDISKLGTTCTGAAGKLFAGGQLVDDMDMELKPKFDGTDVWPVSRELLTDVNDPTSSKIVFPQAYIAGNTWVSGTKGTVSLQLTISGFTVSLDIQNAFVTVDLKDGKGTNGTIAGVLDTEQLVSQIGKVAAAFDTSFCDPESPTLVSILNQLRQASDILKDGSQIRARNVMASRSASASTRPRSSSVPSRRRVLLRRIPATRVVPVARVARVVPVVPAADRS
jgi:hypothetical protein